MIPIRDDIDCQSTPIICYAMMAICSAMFALQIAAGSANGTVVELLGMVPARLTAPPDEPILVPASVVVETPAGTQLVDGVRELPDAIVPEWLTLVTCVFLHGGWLHFLGNMWFLFVFGDNVEDRLGPIAFAVLYIGSGVVAGMFHLVVEFDSTAPTIGASGAIAGVMGAYFWMFPKAKVLTVIPLIFFWPLWVIPAPVFLFVWFGIQFLSGTLAVTRPEVTGVAWWAHIGGFIAGLGCAAALGKPKEQSSEDELLKNRSERRPVEEA